MNNDRKFRALAIAAICIAVVGVSVAYAALSATLKVTGTVTVDAASSWNIIWSKTGNEAKPSSVTVTPITGVNSQILTWGVTFTAPGDYYEFVAEFSNLGTLPAKLVSGTFTPEATGDATLISHLTYTAKIVSDYYVTEAEKELYNYITNIMYSDDFSESYSRGQNQLLIILL